MSHDSDGWALVNAVAGYTSTGVNVHDWSINNPSVNGSHSIVQFNGCTNCSATNIQASQVGSPACGYAPILITGFTGTGPGTLTFTNSGVNGLSAGIPLTFTMFTGGATNLNYTTGTVLSAGLSSTQFEVTTAATTAGSSSGHASANGCEESKPLYGLYVDATSTGTLFSGNSFQSVTSTPYGVLDTTAAVSVYLPNSGVTPGDAILATSTLGKLADSGGSPALTNAANTFTQPQNIPQITGMTTPLSVAQGGRGIGNTAWTSTTPTVTCLSGTPTTITSTIRSQTIGKTTTVNAVIVDTTNGTCGGAFLFNLAALSQNSATGVCVNNSSVGDTGVMALSPSSVQVFVANTTGAASFFANGTTVNCTATYESQ